VGGVVFDSRVRDEVETRALLPRKVFLAGAELGDLGELRAISFRRSDNISTFSFSLASILRTKIRMIAPKPQTNAVEEASWKTLV